MATGGDSLHRSARRGKRHRVAACLDKGDDPNEVDEKGQSALFVACKHGHVEVTKALLEAGAQVNLRTLEGLSPLDAALGEKSKPNSDLIRELVWAGADLESPGLLIIFARNVPPALLLLTVCILNYYVKLWVP